MKDKTYGRSPAMDSLKFAKEIAENIAMRMFIHNAIIRGTDGPANDHQLINESSGRVFAKALHPRMICVSRHR